MSADSGEKSFDPTSSRLEKARAEGNIARSQEFGANLAFVCAVFGVIAIAPTFGAQARIAITEAARGQSVALATAVLFGCALVPMLAGACGGAFASLAQTGGLRVVAVSLKASRLSPVEGLRRMLSRDTLNHAVRASVAFAIAMAFVLASVRAAFSTAGAQASPLRFAALAWDGSLRVVFSAAAVGLAFSIGEYAVARAAWLSKLRMSLHDLKREVKEQDGDPHARARRKSFHRNLIRGALERVKDAAFVVVNPTHIAVALEYRPPEVAVPVVLVRASDGGALRVREEAAKHGVPIVENVPLARALFAQTTVGDVIPHDHYVAIAEIVASLTRAGLLK